MSPAFLLPALDESIVEFGRRELSGDVMERDVAGTFSREDWRKCAERGFLRSLLPAAYGGDEAGVVETVRRLESLGYGCRDNGLTLGLNAQIWTVQLPLVQFGTPAQKERYLPGLAAGELLACDGVTEREAGSDAGALQMTAERSSGGYRLNGRKTYITLAGEADVALVFARTSPHGGAWGVSAFLVDRHTPGFRQEPLEGKMGLRTIPFGDLIFENCLVPEESRLGQEGSGMSIFHFSMDWERGFIQSSHVGAAACLVDRCVAYAKERRQFGRSIGSFQGVTNRIAEMKLRVENARLHLYRMAALKESGISAPMEAALANLEISEGCVRVAEEAVRIHGARGYLRQHGVERELRDMAGGLLYAGTSDIQRNIVGRLLGLSP